MGEIYLAWDTQLERTVALKILPAEVASDQRRMRRFIQEAKAASALNHPNILTIYEIGQAGSAHFISTEVIDGETRPTSPASCTPMECGRVLGIAHPVATSAAAAAAAPD